MIIRLNSHRKHWQVMSELWLLWKKNRHFQILNSFRNGDTFARTGGDEFCLVMTGCMKDLLNRKIGEIMKTFQSACYGEYQCSFSYGLVEIVGKDNEWTLDEILQKADLAMYECKRRNKEKYPALVR